MKSNNLQQAKIILGILSVSLLMESCSPDTPPTQFPDWIVEKVKSGNTVELWSQTGGKHYSIKLACIEAIDNEDSRLLLGENRRFVSPGAACN